MSTNFHRSRNEKYCLLLFVDRFWLDTRRSMWWWCPYAIFGNILSSLKARLIAFWREIKHAGQKRNQMLHLGYNCMVLVHLLVDWLQTRCTERNHKGIFWNDKTKQIRITISKPDPSEKIRFQIWSVWQLSLVSLFPQFKTISAIQNLSKLDNRKPRY